MSDENLYNRPDTDRVEEFDDYLDETTPPIMIAGVKIVPSNALYEADPEAYRAHAEHYQETHRPKTNLYTIKSGNISADNLNIRKVLDLVVITLKNFPDNTITIKPSEI